MDKYESPNDFIIKLQNSANRVLKEAHERDKEAAQIERAKLFAGKKTVVKQDDSNSFTKTGNVLVPTKTLSMAKSMGLDTTMFGGGGDMGKTQMMSYSVPKMQVSMSADTFNFSDPMITDDKRQLGVAESMTTKLFQSSTDKFAQKIDEKRMRNKTLEKLSTSPFIPTTNLSESQSGKKKGITTADTLSVPKESAWNLKSQAAAVLGGKQRPQVNALFRTLLMENNGEGPGGKKTEKIRVDAQGPIDFAHFGLKTKYRGEREREAVWECYQSANAYAQEALAVQQFVLPVAQVERHPMYTLYNRLHNDENLNSCIRTQKRLKMKRFVQDVQEVWLTNLEHLREHQPARVLDEVDNVKQSHSDTANSGHGLANRRDVQAIESMDCQVQSVSHKRSMMKAYHTTRQNPPKVVLDYTAEKTAVMEAPHPLPPVMQPLLREVVLSTPRATILRHSLAIVEGAFQSPPMTPARLNTGRSDTKSPICKTPGTGRSAKSALRSVREEYSNDVLLFVDRLLPNDSAAAAGLHSLYQEEVLWRVSVLRREDVAVRHFVTKEPIAVAFIDHQLAKQGLSVAALGQQQPSHSHGSGDVESFVVHQPRLPIRLSFGSTSVEFRIKIEVLDYKKCTGNNCCSLVVKISGSVVPSLEDNAGPMLQCTSCLMLSAAEINCYVAMCNAPLQDVEWWCSEDRQATLWPDLIGLLQLEQCAPGSDSVMDTPVAAVKDCVPVKLAINCDDAALQERRYTERGLTVLEAVKYSVEFIKYLNINENMELSVTDAAGELFFARDEVNLLTQSIAGQNNLSTSNSNEGSSASESSDLPLEVDEDLINRVNFNKLAAQELAETLSQLYLGDWESAIDKCPNLSLRASDTLDKVGLVPGACEYGRMGLWFGPPDKSTREYSQAALHFFRNKQQSTSNTVFVNVTFALDTARLFDAVQAWDDLNCFPPKCPAEEVDGVIPVLINNPGTVFLDPLISPLEERMSYPAMIFNTIPEEGIDYPPLDMPRKPRGMCRHWPLRNNYGFRQKMLTKLLGVDPVLPTMVFGITKTGATVNNTAVNTRNIWHSTLAITEHINRPRAPKDYHYIVVNTTSRGANDPAAFTIRLRGGEFVDLQSSAFQSFEKEYMEIQERRQLFARQLALDNKIENSQLLLKTKEKILKAKYQKELQRAVEKKMRKTTKSERGWNRRFNMSTCVEVQRNWERRRCDRTGVIFFRNIPPPAASRFELEKYSDTCQWEVPPTWEGDPLAPPVDGGDGFVGAPQVFTKSNNDNDSLKTDSVVTASNNHQAQHHHHHHQQHQLGDFDQPDETWFPGRVEAAVGVTPGARPASTSNVRVGLNKGGPAGTRGHDNVSVLAEESYQESAAVTLDTVNLEHIAEQLLSSDELMNALARRLGLNTNQVVAAEDLSSVFTTVTNNRNKVDDKQVPPGPRDVWSVDAYEPEIASDDDMWSVDDEKETTEGFDENELGILPQNQGDVSKNRRKQYNESHKHDQPVPENMPFINLADKGLSSKDSGAVDPSMGWRKLPRPDISSNFFLKCTETRTIGPDPSSANTFNVPVFLMPISPVDACQYDAENYVLPVESIFIPDAKKDMERAMATLERNIRREEELLKNLPTDDLLLFGEATELTTADTFVAKQFKEDQNAFVDPKEAAMASAILAAKSNNIAAMEDALEEDIPINTADQFGNSLMILAAQQGSKRMCKYLLRKGSNVNFQSLKGNTPLHYCYAYGFQPLGDYLKTRGADDSILNVDGLTCYEGLSKDDMVGGNDDDDFIAEGDEQGGADD